MASRRTDAAARVILFSLMVVFSLLVPPPDDSHRWIMIVPLAGIAAFFRFRFFPLFGPSLFLLMCYLFRLVPFVSLGVAMLAPLVVYALIVRINKRLRTETPRVPWGTADARSALLSLAVVVVSSAALVLWAQMTDPDLSPVTDLLPPDIALGTLVAVGIAFSLVNSFVEEYIYRGVLWEGIAAAMPAPWAALIVQAAFFGIAHMWGVPNGPIGMGLAFTYGLMMGGVRQYSGGILMPTVAHVFADLTIFVMLLLAIGKI
jgi:uncharacterized protein